MASASLTRKPTVLFVCTGNIFRSLIAEYALRSVMADSYQALSAGIKADIPTVSPFVIEAMSNRGIDLSSHRPRRLTSELLVESDLVIAMAASHQKHLFELTGKTVPLFRELCFGEPLDVPDVHDVFEDWRSQPKLTIELFVNDTIDMIFAGVAKMRSLSAGCADFAARLTKRRGESL